MYSMLSKGEVEELIVRPDLEVVTIVLHEGAVIKGKKVSQNECLVFTLYSRSNKPFFYNISSKNT